MNMTKCRRPARPSTILLLSLAALAWTSAAAQDVKTSTPPPDNVGHQRHLHPRNPPHPSQPAPERFTTDRTGAVLPLPAEKDAFSFVVFGDRTGGPVKGVSVLADAIRDVNLIEPDLVMTVGDLIEGYNQSPKWLVQMREYKGIMNRLLCPWFPVAGNHDIYWRGPKGAKKPPGEHEQDYELHFGPLWYAFEHKKSWFIVLFSDEGNPDTGQKTFNKPASQKMSPRQFAWLRATLERAQAADHVFLFLHQPRWLKGGYGDDWDRVHELLKSAGNVSAVFAGHIHRMRYDGRRDGIEYVTLATTGGHQSGRVPSAGYLHHFHTVTVRKSQIAIAAVPVGQFMDVREITPDLIDDALKLSQLPIEIPERLKLTYDGTADGLIHMQLKNVVNRPIDVTILPDSRDSRWFFEPDHRHRVIAPGESFDIEFRVRRLSNSIDAAFYPAELVLKMDYLAEASRYPIPERRIEIPIAVQLEQPPIPANERVADFNGRDDYLRVGSDQLGLPDGPLTLECWFNARSFGKRTGLVNKTEGSEFGFFVNGGRPKFSIFIGRSYIDVQSKKPMLEIGRWHHMAGVFDGRQTRLYLDGRLINSVDRSGKRRTNLLPLIIGADVDAKGGPTSHFDGRIDAVRISTTARYSGDEFTPLRRFDPDEQTALLLNMDGMEGRWLFDQSPRAAHPRVLGSVAVTTVKP